MRPTCAYVGFGCLEPELNEIYDCDSWNKFDARFLVRTLWMIYGSSLQRKNSFPAVIRAPWWVFVAIFDGVLSKCQVIAIWLRGRLLTRGGGPFWVVEHQLPETRKWHAIRWETLTLMQKSIIIIIIRSNASSVMMCLSHSSRIHLRLPQLFSYNGLECEEKKSTLPLVGSVQYILWH